jgi:hypothetical protein
MDVSKIIQSSGLRFDYVAEKLFPGNKFPYNALLRLVNKNAELSESQIITLAEMLNVTPNDLLGDVPKWKGAISGSALVLTYQAFEVDYSPTLGTYTLHQNGVYLGTFATPQGISVKDFLKTITDQIKTV